MIILRNIYKKYNDNYVLKNINIKFPEKGLIMLLGKSGSGKSTLLNIIGGIDTPTSGSIFYKGIEINKLKKNNINKYHKKEVSFIFQNYNLINYLTVEDNILLGRKKTNINYLLKKVNLYDKKNTKVYKLSGGEQERVAIARALYNNPKVLLCDEPTGALDSKTSESIMEYLKRYSENNLVIMVTHDEQIANTYGDQIIRIVDGKIDSNLEDDIIENYSLKKVNTPISNIINIAKNNIKNKKKRYIFSILANMIGLISLLLILGMSNGFNKSLKEYEKTSLSEYPLIVSETSEDIEKLLSDTIKIEDKTDDKIYIKKQEKTNIINEDLLNIINNLKGKTNYIQCNYYYNNIILTTFKNYNSNYENKFELLDGLYPQKENELLLVVNSKNEIDAEYTKGILDKENYNIKNLVNKSIVINKEKYIIKGIAKGKKDSSFYDTNYLIINKEIKQLPIEIEIYASNYKDKEYIKEYLLKNNIKYMDYASTVTSISKNVLNAISYVLIIFCLISLSVSVLMVSLITYMSIYERTKEIGILSSLGFSIYNIKSIFYIENIIVSIISCEISIFIMNILKSIINKIIYAKIGLSNIINIDFKIIIIIITMNIMLAVIASIIPLRKINKIKIIDCLKND